jgi:O-antigen ligase
VTRGAIIALVVGVAYMLWTTRRTIRFHELVLGLAAALGGTLLVLNVVAHHTHSGNVLERLGGTTFVGGVPDTRAGVWQAVFERILHKPIFGHGPYYSIREGVQSFFWPHNGYLFYWYILGIVGLAAFLWIVLRLWRASARHTSRLDHPAYAASLLVPLRAMLILFLVDQTKIDYLRNEIYMYLVWLFFGLTVAASRIAAEQEQRGVAPLPAEGVSRRRPLPWSAAPASTG